MRELLERLGKIRGRHGEYLLEGKNGQSGLAKFLAKHGIVGEKARPEHSVNSIGYSEKEDKWWGWSHRAAVGFGIGDKIFEPDFGDDKTLFVQHGSKTIKNMDDAKKSAIAFARDVS